MTTAQEPVQCAPADLPEMAGGVELFLHVLSRTSQLRCPPVRAAVWQQVQRGAVEIAGFTAVIGVLAGFFTIATVELGFGVGVSIGVRLLQALVLGQLAGFVCALVLVAGPGTAAVFELGLMRRHGELRTLRLIGIDPRDYLVIPRVLGFGLALFVLTLVFQAAAALGGTALVALVTPLTFLQQVEALGVGLGPAALGVSALQSVVLGGTIGILVCRQGLGSTFSTAEMPRIARRLLSRAVIALVVVQAGAAVLLFS